MLGFIAAVGAELATGRKVSQQVAIAPGPIAAVFLLFTVASMIPILKVMLVTLLSFYPCALLSRVEIACQLPSNCLGCVPIN